jgi:hypothetical protein
MPKFSKIFPLREKKSALRAAMLRGAETGVPTPAPGGETAVSTAKKATPDYLFSAWTRTIVRLLSSDLVAYCGSLVA